MISRNTVLSSSFLLCISICFNVGISQPRAKSCFDDAVYDVNNTTGKEYRKNLETLLTTLYSNATTPTGFSSSTAGTANAIVYGLFLCRGDASPGDCQTCLKTATDEGLTSECPNQARANIFYDDCMLRFSDEPIVSKLDTSMAWYLWDPLSNYTDGTLLNKVLTDTFSAIAEKTAYGNEIPGKRYAVQEAGLKVFEKIYALAQCTPDITDLECDNCLTEAISNLPGCCTNKRGGRVIFPSCHIRYESSQFYRNPAPAPPPTVAPPPPPTVAPPPPTSPVPVPGSNNQGEGGFSTNTTVAIVVPTIVAIFAVVVVFYAIWKAKRGKTHNIQDHRAKGESSISIDHVEFIRYKLSQVEACTSNFSAKNMIGRGGFGSVYKGTFQNEQIVAVKRLSKGSKQGGGEFMNEITVVAKLRHKNLVRLLGYCFERDERILIYEFVVNKSLDYFLFDPEKQPLLDWSMRYNIIEGIARGLLYLHEDSRITIIHRDLKAANVLLDGDMNPKITDFGLARLLESDQCEGNTRKIAGTFGYMAPEYLLYGKLSVKLDVFSFGVLVMEIISGKRNNDIQCFGGDDLLTYARKQWRNGTPLAVMDPAICGIYDRNEVIRCIYVGLLCVVKKVERRPSMASVVLMLTSCSIQLPIPNEPAFFDWRRTSEIQVDTDSDKRSSQPENSINEVSMTEFYPR